MNNKNTSSNKNIKGGKHNKIAAVKNFFGENFPQVIGFAMLVILIVAIALGEKTNFRNFVWISGIIYLSVCGISIFIKSKKSSKDSTALLNDNLIYKAVSKTLSQHNSPVLVVSKDGDGVIVWANKNAEKVLKKTNLQQVKFKEVLNSTWAPVEAEIINHRAYPIAIGGEPYEITGDYYNEGGSKYFVIYLDSTNKYEELKLLKDNKEICVATVAMDNTSELSSSVMQNEYKDADHIIYGVLKNWAEDLDAVFKEIGNYRYIILFYRERLNELKGNKFSILKKIEEAQLNAQIEVPLSVSMGVSDVGDTLAEREKLALTALELAMQKGGAQVAVYSAGNKYEYFGATAKGSQKRISIRSRMEANRLVQLIKENNSNKIKRKIIIMGHAYPDFDAIGACIGLARFIEAYGGEPLIVTDLHCDNFKTCTANLFEAENADYYKDLFVDSERGLDEFKAGALVILADVNNPQRCECKQIAKAAGENVAIIDHHRRGKDDPVLPYKINYIDPTASSTCELVTEMIDYSEVRVVITPEEATVMMSGIMLDTQNFVKAVGPRTFSAAVYLRNAGANTEEANEFFYESIRDFHRQRGLGAKARIYPAKDEPNAPKLKYRYAIASGILNTDADVRIEISKLANRLVELKDADASFVIAFQGTNCYISGRSKGKVNVQLILEKMGGGGHFDAAATFIKDGNIEAVTKQLQEQINYYEAELNKPVY